MSARAHLSENPKSTGESSVIEIRHSLGAQGVGTRGKQRCQRSDTDVPLCARSPRPTSPKRTSRTIVTPLMLSWCAGWCWRSKVIRSSCNERLERRRDPMRYQYMLPQRVWAIRGCSRGYCIDSHSWDGWDFETSSNFGLNVVRCCNSQRALPPLRVPKP